MHPLLVEPDSIKGTYLGFRAIIQPRFQSRLILEGKLVQRVGEKTSFVIDLSADGGDQAHSLANRGDSMFSFESLQKPGLVGGI